MTIHIKSASAVTTRSLLYRAEINKPSEIKSSTSKYQEEFKRQAYLQYLSSYLVCALKTDLPTEMALPIPNDTLTQLMKTAEPTHLHTNSLPFDTPTAVNCSLTLHSMKLARSLRYYDIFSVYSCCLRSALLISDYVKCDLTLNIT